MSHTKSALRVIIPVLVGAFLVFGLLELAGKPPDLLPNPPELRAKNHLLSLTLHAATTSDGKGSFYFNGQPNAPTLRVSPGDRLKIAYINDLPSEPHERCLIGPCMDMTNLHFHGLTVSPNAPQDDVLDMMAVAWTSTPLQRPDPQRPSAWTVLVPHPSSRRELPTSAGRHVWGARNRGNSELCSCARWSARACAGGSRPFRWE